MFKNFPTARHATGIRFAVDRGGTFTDVCAVLPDGQGIRTTKLLSVDPTHYEDAPREGIRRILQNVMGRSMLADRVSSQGIEWIRMGTTVATNALLERRGERMALVVTCGFRDLLRIGNQSRPRIFDLEIQKPDLLYESVIEVDERVRLVADGEDVSDKEVITGDSGEQLIVVSKPNRDEVRQKLQAVYEQGIRSLAVVFAHAYTYTEHEKLIAEMAREIGFIQISLSHDVMPMVKMVARGDTTAVDAYLTPHIRRYIESFRSGFVDDLEGVSLLFMQSDGGLVPADHFKGSHAVLSGPAGGVVGYSQTTYEMMGEKPVIGFDMGGTSTDVSRYGGDYELVHESVTAGVRVQAPQMAINTVAAGGGSRLFFRNGMFEVGPESAGAHPGPVCYRKDGHLAITDANLVLGRLQPEHFPRIFGPDQNEPLDYEATMRAFEELTDQVNAAYQSSGHEPLSLEQVALGFLTVANEVMIRPIREVSVMRGFDVQEHVLASFGGAGGQHACAIARELGMSQVFVHRFSGILSAYGIGLADVVVEDQKPSTALYDATHQAGLKTRLDDLEQRARQSLLDQGYSEDRVVVQRYLHLRYEGTDTSIMVLQPDDLDFAASFRAMYIREYGFDLADRPIVVDDIRVRALAKSDGLHRETIPESDVPPRSIDNVQCYFEAGWLNTALYRLEDLKATQSIDGPAIILQDASTILIEPGCRATITQYGDVVIDILEHKASKSYGVELDPILLSVFSHLFMSVAEQMGRTLQRTAISTNIKERLDFSCAVFDAGGDLIANAPHLPVHLGAMGEAVRHQIRLQGKDLREGDVLVTNHPAVGGSHLPDVTVITPVFKNGRIIFFVASRGHHADIGGISPGSMPPFSKTLEDEGASILSFKLVEGGVFDEGGITELLMAPEKVVRAEGELPLSGTRALSDNISDLRAQVAANQRGVDLLLEMVDVYSLQVVQAYMSHIQRNAETAVREKLKELSLEQGLDEVDSVYAEDFLDDGSPIRLKLTIDRRDGSAIFDFTGTGAELSGNLNTPQAVVYSAILYALRCLVDQDIPLNQGCLNSITVIIEDGSLLSPSETAAVVGGNVLTSQRVTDVIFQAFQAAADSQGCMNNLTFGNNNFGYYETIGGGAGAGNGWDGQSGVQTHMTNTRITDPEVLERRYPVVLKEFSIRDGSGGKGRFRGGDGLVRDIEFLAELSVGILSERRVYPPSGLQGGGPGAVGVNLYITPDGAETDLGGKNEVEVHPGDRIRILTPGGGGFGTEPQSE